MSEKRAKKRLWTWLKPIAGLAILGFVFSQLPFQDSVKWTAEGGEAVRIPGEIQTNWKADAIEFLPDEDWSGGPAAPPGFEGWTAGTVVSLARPEDTQQKHGFDWEPGLPRAFGAMAPGWFLLGLAAFFVGNLLVTTRWWRLLALAGCPTTWGTAFRLNFLGLFFSSVVPGLTGGDLVKTAIVVRDNPGRRADALMTVVVDRLLGLLILAAVAMVAILCLGEDFADLRLPVLGFLLAGIGGACVYLNPSLRRLVRFDALLAKLPAADKIKLIDEAAQLYARHPGELLVASGISLVNHFLYCSGVCALGIGLGLSLQEVSFLQYFALVPVANIVSAVPLMPGGWGLGELIYRFLFDLVGATPALGVAVSVFFRICQTLLGLLGGLFLVLPGAKIDLKEIEAEADAEAVA